MSSSLPTAEQVAGALDAAARGELSGAMTRIRHCLNQLTDEQVWWRADQPQNCIGNLVLHLAGNLRQWIVVGLGGGEDTRNRPGEFAERGGIPRAELLARLEQTVQEASAVLSRLPPDELLRKRRIQGFELTGVEAIFDSVPHFRGHTQEIIHMTRTLLGDAYRFWWAPATPEQGA